MINIIHIPTGRDGMLRRGGNKIIRERIPQENCNTFTNLEDYGRIRRNEVVDMVAQEVS
jgi:hypothetical protein|tara:strand:- start:2040 stop:2216 length:177 start_codon:yes stop_codon:yes gene_type:complete